MSRNCIALGILTVGIPAFIGRMMSGSRVQRAELSPPPMRLYAIGAQVERSITYLVPQTGYHESPPFHSKGVATVGVGMGRSSVFRVWQESRTRPTIGVLDQGEQISERVTVGREVLGRGGMLSMGIFRFSGQSDHRDKGVSGGAQTRATMCTDIEIIGHEHLSDN